jgi:predicted dinucleotide-binding enzyme
MHWAKAGRRVVFGSRDPEHERVQELLCRINPQMCAELPHVSVADAEVIVVAVPWPEARTVLESLGELRGKILIDCTNPLKPDLSGLATDGQDSAAEQIARWCPEARVVKAFNTASVKVMANPNFGGQPATMFYCGDDAEAKKVVRELIAEVGFEPVDSGPLTSARYLESLAMLYIHLAVKQGWGSNCAFKIMKR